MRPRLQVLEPDMLGAILEEAFNVLETNGIAVDTDQHRQRLKHLGLTVVEHSQRITIPRAIAQACVEQCPACFTLYNRDGQPHATVGEDNLHFVPASSALRVLDRHTEEVRLATRDDFIEYVKVADGLQHLSFLSTAFVPHEVAEEVADAWRLYLGISYSRQPFASGSLTAHGVPRMGRIMSLFRRDRSDLARSPMALFTCCPNTPLRWGTDSLQNLLDCADWGIPVEIVPSLLLGMTSPVTLVGSLVLHTAEVLSGLTIAQLVRPGMPIVFGAAPATFHMQWMTCAMTGVEALQMMAACSQIAEQLNLPAQGYLGLSDAKLPDMQAGAESGVGMFLAALSGMHLASGAGMLDFVNCFSLEKLVFDNDLAAYAHRFMRPLKIRRDLPVGPLLDELLEEKQLLTAQHTLQFWPDELFLPGDIIDRTNWSQWKQQGSRDLRERARAAISRLLAEYNVAPLAPELHREIRQILDSRCSHD